MSPVYGSVAKKPSSAPGPADVAGDVGRAQEHVLDPAHHLVGLGQRGADRHVVVEDERAFVHVGHEAGLKRVDLDGIFSNRDRQSVKEDPARHDRQQRQQHDRLREPEADLQGPLVDVRQPVIDRARRRHRATAQEAGGQDRDDRQADDHRDHQRDGQRDAQRLEELADHPADERQRHEDQDRRQGRADDRAADLAAGPVHGQVAGLPLGQMPRDVLDHDHGIIDDQADGHGQAAQRHQVERVSGQVEEDEADDEAQRDRERGDQGRSQALEEHQEDGNAHQTADDDGVADVGDRRADQQPLVVDRMDLDAWRGTPGRVGQHVLQRARDRQRVASQAAEDGQGDGVLAVGPDRHRPVLVPDRHPAEVAQPDRLAVLLGDDPVLQVERIACQRVGQHLVLQRPAIEAPDGLEPVLLVQSVGHVGDREVGRHEGLRVDLDQDLADVAPLHGDVGDVRDAADPGPQVVVGVVVQRRRIAPAGDDERDDREDRRGLPLGDRGGPGREAGRRPRPSGRGRR